LNLYEAFLEQTSDKRHEFEWTENQLNFRFQFKENWNPKFREWTLWKDVTVQEARIDTSAALFGKDSAKKPMKNIEIGRFTATYKLPAEDFCRKVSTIVCSINGGRWKVVPFIGLGERE
jgi:hypothetical protein